MEENKITAPAVITSRKKHCPFCYWTAVTNETHCPNIALSPAVHAYNLSVPLVDSGPDTSKQHKYARREYRESQYEIMKSHKRQMEEHGGKIHVPLERIRFLQQKARKEGRVNDGIEIRLDK